MKINKILLTIILSAAFLLRIFQLENVPPGFYKDEAFIGFDVFSLTQTGKDFHGNPWPLYFEDSRDWRNPVYYYTAIPSIAYFGLTIFATRLPAVIYGTLSVLALFLVARELLDKKKALLAAAFVAVSPWSFVFSRIAFESAALPALLLFALWLFLRGFRHPRSWIASAMLFALSLYTYVAAPVFIPLFLFTLLIIFKEKLIAAKKHLIKPAIIFLILSLPLAATVLFSSDTFFARSRSVSVFYDPSYSPFRVFGNYLQFYSADFLFMNGDHNFRMSPPNYGKLLWFMAPLLLAGIYTSMRSFNTERSKLLIVWLLIFPVAGIFANDSPYAHSTRSIVGIGLFELLAVIGASSLFDAVKKRTSQITAISVAILFLLFASINAFWFLRDYFTEYPVQAASPVWFQDGLKEAFGFIKQNQNNYDYVVLSPKLDNAKVYSAFYMKTDPREVQTSREKISQCELSACGLKGKILLLNLEEDRPEGTIIKTIKNNAGKNVFRLETVNIE